MLDIEQSGVPESGSSSTDSTPPTRRRRSASRPAGAPSPIVINETATTPAPAASNTGEISATKAPTRRRATSRSAASKAQTSKSEATEDQALATTKARSRKSEATEDHASAAIRQTSAVTDEASTTKPQTRRRTATKATTRAKADIGDETATNGSNIADEVAPKRRASTRRSSKSVSSAVSEGQDTLLSAVNDLQSIEPASDAGEAQTPRKRAPRKTASKSTDESDSSEKTARKSTGRAATNRSRKSTKAAEISDVESATETGSEVPSELDAVAASLGELKQRNSGSRRRRNESAKVFDVAGDSTEGVLDALAAAIRSEHKSENKPDKADDVPAEAPLDNEANKADDLADESGDFESQRNRRRRRGGRRRRRNGDDFGNDGQKETDVADSNSSDVGSSTETEPKGNKTDSGVISEDLDGQSAGTRRRRRRRRRGEEIGEAEDDPMEVIVRVREPRRSNSTASAGSTSDEVTSIEGSTRMEAKRQRRREGRPTGRRRTPILSEAEFLARRESVERTMLVRQAEDYSQIAVLEDGVLVEHYVDRAAANSMIGNVYLGRVQNVLPSMEAAFIDIGRHRNAVLYAGEVDWETSELTGEDKKIENIFKSGQSVLVQVSKDPVGTKGARLTAHLSIPGRYIVYSPGGHLSGVSRKLPEGERQRLKSVLDDLIPEKASVIVRTAAEGAAEEELIHDVNRVKAQWEVIEKKSTSQQAPQLLYSEPDLAIRIVRDLFGEDFTRLVIDGNGQLDDSYDSISAYIEYVAPHLSERLVRWDRETSGDLFDAHRVQEQVMKALERKVFLPSGGSLVIDRTEAMTVIDVNTGRFTGTAGNLEATVTANNLEAAEEIVRQLRLRDIGGIIVVDFIDMVLPQNRELLLRRLVECLGRDRTRHQVAEVTSLGLVQMTRKKIGTGLAEAFTIPCETCKGRGYHVHDAPVQGQTAADGGDRDSNRRKGGGKHGGLKSKGKGEDKPKKSKNSGGAKGDS